MSTLNYPPQNKPKVCWTFHPLFPFSLCFPFKQKILIRDREEGSGGKNNNNLFQRFYLKTDTKPTDLQTMTMLLLLLLLLPVVAVVVVVHSTAQMCCLRVLYTKGQLRVREKERESGRENERVGGECVRAVCSMQKLL